MKDAPASDRMAIIAKKSQQDFEFSVVDPFIEYTDRVLARENDIL